MTSANDDLPVQDELTVLKARADLLGVKYHPSIGVEALRAKVNAAMADPAEAGSKQAVGYPGQGTDPNAEQVFGVETEHQKRVRLKREAEALVRIRLTCMNPLKKEWPGEILTVGNDVVGTHRKFIPYTGADDGWHVPQILLDALQSKECQVFKTVTIHGQKVRRGHLIKEYAIEILPALTESELHDLAQRQAMAGGLEA